jgi:hypothetical protein
MQVNQYIIIPDVEKINKESVEKINIIFLRPYKRMKISNNTSTV